MTNYRLILAVTVIVSVVTLLLGWMTEAKQADSKRDLDMCEFYTRPDESPEVFPSVRHVEVRCGGEVISYERFFFALMESNSFMLRFKDLLSYQNGLFFECPPLTVATLKTNPAQFVLIPSKDGDNSFRNMMPDPATFSSHFNSCAPGKDVVRFYNIGRNAVLVSPCPSDREHESYGHLGIFAQNSSPRQFSDLWRLCVSSLLEELNTVAARGDGQKLWLSTHGLGVSWLHIRIDYKPKYYHYRPFKIA